MIGRKRANTSPTVPLPADDHDRPEQMLEERFAGVTADGVIREGDTRRAVRELTALTFLLALDALRSGVDRTRSRLARRHLRRAGVVLPPSDRCARHSEDGPCGGRCAPAP